MYALTSQMRRSAVSVPSNIVEGCARESQIEFLRFLEIAFASLIKTVLSAMIQNLGVGSLDSFFAQS
jgi:four helix bundle protein